MVDDVVKALCEATFIQIAVWAWAISMVVLMWFVGLENARFRSWTAEPDSSIGNASMMDDIIHLAIGGFFGAMLVTAFYGIFHIQF